MNRGPAPALGCPICKDPRPGYVKERRNRADVIERVRVCEVCGTRRRTRETPAGVIRKWARQP
jgi:transcriptional regulator NrdR family protein